MQKSVELNLLNMSLGSCNEEELSSPIIVLQNEINIRDRY